MTVYIDNARIPLGRMLMCHMLADSLDELHSMADKIGVNRKYFHDGHYNVCASKRALALAFGAQGVTVREMVNVRARLRNDEGRPEAASKERL